MNPPHVHLPWSQNMRSVGNEAPPIEWTCSEEKRVGSEGHHVERNIRMGSYISNESRILIYLDVVIEKEGTGIPGSLDL